MDTNYSNRTKKLAACLLRDFDENRGAPNLTDEDILTKWEYRLIGNYPENIAFTDTNAKHLVEYTFECKKDRFGNNTMAVPDADWFYKFILDYLIQAEIVACLLNSPEAADNILDAIERNWHRKPDLPQILGWTEDDNLERRDFMEAVSYLASILVDLDTIYKKYIEEWRLED